MGVQCGFDSFDITLKWLILVISTLNISRTEWSNTSGLAIWRESFRIISGTEISSHSFIRHEFSKPQMINYCFLHIALPEVSEGFSTGAPYPKPRRFIMNQPTAPPSHSAERSYMKIAAVEPAANTGLVKKTTTAIGRRYMKQ